MVAGKQTGNIIELLRQSIAAESKKGGKTKSPSIAPALPKSKAKTKQRA